MRFVFLLVALLATTPAAQAGQAAMLVFGPGNDGRPVAKGLALGDAALFQARAWPGVYTGVEGAIALGSPVLWPEPWAVAFMAFGGTRMMVWHDAAGVRYWTPPGMEPASARHAPIVAVTVTNALGNMGLTETQQRHLDHHGWADRVGDGLGVWVSVDEQVLRILSHGEVVWQAPCATATAGTGQQMGSLQTPLGWHRVRRKTGADEPWGRVFRGGIPTRERWQPGDDPEEDLVLTRILFLEGLEPGLNKGGEVDSYDRYIYIHGTNGEPLIGTPSSHGCIRLRNDDVIAAYGRIPVGTPVLISEGIGNEEAPG